MCICVYVCIKSETKYVNWQQTHMLKQLKQFNILLMYYIPISTYSYWWYWYTRSRGLLLNGCNNKSSRLISTHLNPSKPISTHPNSSRLITTHLKSLVSSQPISLILTYLKSLVSSRLTSCIIMYITYTKSDAPPPKKNTRIIA